MKSQSSRVDRPRRHGRQPVRGQLLVRDVVLDHAAARQRQVQRVEQLVLDVEHGARPGPAARAGPLRVVHERRGDDLQVRDAEEVLLQALAVRRAVAAAAAGRRADDHRAGDLAVVHRLVLGDVVDDLVEAERQEVAEHDLGDRPVAGQRQAGGDAGDRALADRRRAHAVGEVGAQAARDLEGARRRGRRGPRRAGRRAGRSSRAARSASPMARAAITAPAPARRRRRSRPRPRRRCSRAPAGPGGRPWISIGSSAQRAATSSAGRLSSFLE